MAFESKDPETLKVVHNYGEAMATLPASLVAELNTIIDESCKPAEFRMRHMNAEHGEIGRIIAVGIMLRMTLLIEEFPGEEE